MVETVPLILHIAKRPQNIELSVRYEIEACMFIALEIFLLASEKYQNVENY